MTGWAAKRAVFVSKEKAGTKPGLFISFLLRTQLPAWFATLSASSAVAAATTSTASATAALGPRPGFIHVDGSAV
jgi:hypothetical protein